MCLSDELSEIDLHQQTIKSIGLMDILPSTEPNIESPKSQYETNKVNAFSQVNFYQ